jgi:hypothetical protein
VEEIVREGVIDRAAAMKRAEPSARRAAVTGGTVMAWLPIVSGL